MSAPTCERCGVEPAKPGDWMHCEHKEVGRMSLQWHRAAKPPDLLLRVMRGRVPSLRLVDRQWRADCPWCDEAGEPFHVYQDIYHCYACGASGDAIQFMMAIEGLRFVDAVQWLAAEAGIAP